MLFAGGLTAAAFASCVAADPISSRTIILVARDSTSILKYEPSVANYVVGAIFAVYTAVISYNIWKRRDRWALCLPIGTLCSAVGYLIRPSMSQENTSLALYATQTFLVVISPCAFLAFNYLLYGRMILAIDSSFGEDHVDTEALQSSSLTPTQKLTMIHKAGGPKRERSRFSFVPPRIVARVFVWSDVCTFLIQCCAGGMQASGGADNPNLTEIGDKLFLVGVILQGISYLLFTALLTYATFKVIREGSSSGRRRQIFGLDAPTFCVVAGLYISSLAIIIRSIYRIVEFAQGYTGYLITHEVYLFALDSAPLLVAVGVWAIMWPTDLLAKTLSDRFEKSDYPLL